MSSLRKEIESKKKEFGKIFIFSILGIFICFIALVFILQVLEFYEPLIPIKTLSLIFLVISYTSYLVSKTEFDFWPIYKIMTVTLAVLNFYFSLYIYKVSSIIFLFYIPIALMVLMLTNLKKSFVSSLFLIILCYFTPNIADYFNISMPIMYSQNYLILNRAQDYAIMFFSIYLSFLILYYYNEFNKIESKHSYLGNFDLSSETIEQKGIFISEKNDLSSEKTSLIYTKITNYFEDKKPFTNPDFSMLMLSKQLNINPTYIYKALKENSNKSFRDLVNEYRINQVVAEINANAHKKFTIEHIYVEAGFVQQSTFNRVFKKTTGRTPSQYIEQQEYEKHPT